MSIRPSELLPPPSKLIPGFNKLRRNSSTVTSSEAQTQAEGAKLADRLFSRQPAFVQLSGPLGAGKSAFARGFIRRWSVLAGDPSPDTMVSPTYNIVKVYGHKAPIAHFDLYRLKSLSELEQIGVEHYFYEYPACLVEWLEQVPEALRLRPANTIVVEISFSKKEGVRELKIQDQKELCSAP